MLLGPIFTADVVTSGRRLRYFLLRAAYAIILFLLLWMNYETAFALWRSSTPIQQAAEFASSFFGTFAVTQLFAVLLVAPALTAASLAAERERRTIEYLFATDLTNSEIVLSKLTSRLLQVGCLMLAGVPVLAIAMLMGGIGPAQLVLVLVITLSTAVTASALGLAISVSAPRVRDALGRVYVILFALLVIPGIVKLMSFSASPWQTAVYTWIGPANEILFDANPVKVLWESVWTPSNLRRGTLVAVWAPVATMVLYHLLFTSALSGFAVWSVRRVHLRAAGRLPIKSNLRPLRSRMGPGEFPMLWKELVVGGGATNWGFAGRLASLLIALAVTLPTVWLFFTAVTARDFMETATILGTMLACGSLLVTAGRAATSISGEKERDTWLTLISTPLEAREIVLGKIVGTLLSQRGTLALLGAIWLLEILRSPSSIAAVLSTGIALANLTLFATSLGTLFSLQSRNSTRAIGATLTILIFVGGGYLLCCGGFLMLGGPWDEIIFAPAMPFLLACPLMLDDWSKHGASSSEFAEAAFTWLLGNGAYLVAGLLLCGLSVNGFDRLAGRTGIEPDEPRKRLGQY